MYNHLIIFGLVVAQRNERIYTKSSNMVKNYICMDIFLGEFIDRERCICHTMLMESSFIPEYSNYSLLLHLFHHPSLILGICIFAILVIFVKSKNHIWSTTSWIIDVLCKKKKKKRSEIIIGCWMLEGHQTQSWGFAVWTEKAIERYVFGTTAQVLGLGDFCSALYLTLCVCPPMFFTAWPGYIYTHH